MRKSSREQRLGLPKNLVVWDANPFNPYGGEVARILALLGPNVRRYCRPETALQAPGVDERPIIPKGSGGIRDMRTMVGHVVALSRFMLYVIARRPVVILPWTEKHERPVIAAIQLLAIRTIIVVHNPVPGRDEATSDARVVRLRRRAERLVVHTPRLVAEASKYGRVTVAPHPSYAGWVASMERLASRSTRAADRTRRALYLGSPRADKGFDSIPALAKHLSANGMELTVAVGMLSKEQRVELEEVGNVSLPSPGTRYLSDADIYASLSDTDVLVAPYHNVTVSGTVLMGISLGLPVVAFSSEAMRDVLDASYLVEPGDLAAMASLSASVAARTHHRDGSADSASLDARSARGWREALLAAQGQLPSVAKAGQTKNLTGHSLEGTSA